MNIWTVSPFTTGDIKKFRPTRRVEEVRGVSGLHSILTTGLLDKLMDEDFRQRHWVCPGRPGLRLDPENVFCIDFAVVTKEKLPPQAISNDLMQVPPELTVEIDISVACEEISRQQYIDRKIRHLIAFGTQRVIWIFLNRKQILIAEPGKAKRIVPFTDDFELMNGIVFNISRFAQKNGFTHLRYD